MLKIGDIRKIMFPTGDIHIGVVVIINGEKGYRNKPVTCHIFNQYDKNKHDPYTEDCALYLDNMYIDENYRRYGIGSLLINELKKYCREKKIQNIKVTASAKNNKAINFYMKNVHLLQANIYFIILTILSKVLHRLKAFPPLSNLLPWYNLQFLQSAYHFSS